MMQLSALRHFCVYWIAFAAVPIAPRLVFSGQIADAIGEAKVLQHCETGGFPILEVRVAENLIAATIRSSDSTTMLKAWDIAGHVLFEKAISHKFVHGIDGDPGGYVRAWLGSVSPDGSTLAYSEGSGSLLIDRGGRVLATLPVYTPEPSPTGKYWVSATSRGPCESDAYGLFDRAGNALSLDTTGRMGHAYGVFLSDSELAIQWSDFGAVHQLPSGVVRSWYPPEDFFSDEHGPVKVSPSGFFHAVVAGRPGGIQLRERDGSIKWASDSIDADILAFSPDERWMAMFTDVYSRESGLTLLNLSSLDESFSFSFARSNDHISWVWAEWIETGEDSLTLLSLRTPEDVVTKFIVIDMNAKAIADSLTVDGGYLAVPGFPDLFCKTGVIVGDPLFEGSPFRERVKTSLDLVLVSGLVRH
jgi:hypothetical protein